MKTPEQDEPVYDSRCLVCLKTVGSSEGVTHGNMGNRWITICCPLCYEAFKDDPETFLKRDIPPREPGVFQQF
jgi:hypothetical protein